jgi:hypothetical protein
LVDINDEIDNIDLPDDAEDPRVEEISTNSNLMFQMILY